MIKIQLSKKGATNKGLFESIVDACDSDLAERSWTVRKPSSTLIGKTQYAFRTFGERRKPTTVWLHNAIAERFLGPRPEGMVTDHINGNGLDNRRSNLQYLTVNENCRKTSMKRSNSSGVTGVDFCKVHGKWKARITVLGKRKSLGYYKDFSDAVTARVRAEKIMERHGSLRKMWV